MIVRQRQGLQILEVREGGEWLYIGDAVPVEKERFEILPIYAG